MTKEERDLAEKSTFELEQLKKEILRVANEKADKIQRILNSRLPYPYSSKEERRLLTDLAKKYNLAYVCISSDYHIIVRSDIKDSSVRDIMKPMMEEMISDPKYKVIKDYYLLKGVKTAPW